MRVSQAYVGLNLAELLPDSAVKTKHLGIFIADYHARRYDARQARRNAATPDSHYANLLTQFDEMLSELTRLRDTTINDPLSIQVKKAKKLTNRLHKCINELDREEKEMPFGGKAENLIYTISSIVLRELEEMSGKQSMIAYDYLIGKDKHYWLTTTTQSLCTGLNRNNMTPDIIHASASEKRESKQFQNKTSAFRGADGLYAQLEASGFLLDKVVDGTKVRLKVNLDWIFGWSLNIMQDPAIIAEMNAVEQSLKICKDAVEPFFSESTSENITRFSWNNKFKETENRLSGLTSSDLLIPTIVGKEGEESEEKENPAVENQSTGGEIFEENEEKEIPAPTASPDDVLIECAKDSANRALRLIFNKKNVENGRIKHNSTSLPVKISQDDSKNIKYWMLGAYTHIRNLNPANDWLTIAEMVNEAIEHRAKYLEKDIEKYNYPPHRWLDLQYSGGTLTKYVERYLLNRPEKEPKTDYFETLHKNYAPSFAWLIEKGFDKSLLHEKIRKYGEDVINDAIAYIQLKCLVTNFKPKNGTAAYASGVFYKMNPKTIRLDAEKLMVKYNEQQKSAQNKIYWTPQRVYDVFMEVTEKTQYLRQFFVQEDLNDFVKIYKNRPANNDGQLKIQIDDLLKERRNIAQQGQR